MNRTFLTGHLTRAPELKLTPDGSAKVCNFGVASNERWTDQMTGEPRETVCYVDCEAWNRTAELIFENFKKGSPILIEGNLKFEAWVADDGTNRNRLKVRVQRFEFMQPNPSPAPVTPEPKRNARTEHPQGTSQPPTDDQPPF